MADTPSNDAVFVKEMGINHRDFFRILPRALDSEDFQRSPTGAVFEDGDKRLEISLGPEGKRTIALLSMPVTMVTLRFVNYGADEITSAMERFDLYFRRGGG